MRSIDKKLKVCYNGSNPSSRGACAEEKTAEKSGFTIIEVMLVLGLTGMLLIGLLGGTFASIASQRYSDSVRSFAEYLRQEYSEVLSPESLGAGNSQKYAIYGKAIVFGHDYGNEDDNRRVYSAIVIGDAKIPESIDGGFITELANVNLMLYCGQALATGAENGNTSVDYYDPLWQSSLTVPENKGLNNPQFKGTVIIARTPTSGAIHTIYTQQTYDLKNNCDANNGGIGASTAFHDDLYDFVNSDTVPDDKKFEYESVGICVTSENSSLYREVRIARDGHNTSAISTLSTDIEDEWLEEGIEGNKCNE